VADTRLCGEDEELSSTSEDEGVPRRKLGAEGQVLPASQGLDLEALLAEVQHSHNEAGYRFRGMLQEELDSSVPELDPSIAAQVLTLDLDALASSLACLPLQGLLGLPEEHAHWLAMDTQQRQAKASDDAHKPLPMPYWKRDLAQPLHRTQQQPSSQHAQSPALQPQQPTLTQTSQQQPPLQLAARYRPVQQQQQQQGHDHDDDDELDILLGLKAEPSHPRQTPPQAASPFPASHAQPQPLAQHHTSSALGRQAASKPAPLTPMFVNTPSPHHLSRPVAGVPRTAAPLAQQQQQQQQQQEGHDDELDELLGLKDPQIRPQPQPVQARRAPPPRPQQDHDKDEPSLEELLGVS